jgi:hypothetical protein
MELRMDVERGALDLALAGDCPAVEIDHDQVVGACLRPMQAVRDRQVAVLGAG